MRAYNPLRHPTAALSALVVCLAAPMASAQGASAQGAAAHEASAPPAKTAPASGPMYKPSSRSAAPIDISTDAYGAFRFAPDAPHVGDKIADFTLPATTGLFRLEDARKKGEVVIIFYRGDW